MKASNGVDSVVDLLTFDCSRSINVLRLMVVERLASLAQRTLNLKTRMFDSALRSFDLLQGWVP